MNDEQLKEVLDGILPKPSHEYYNTVEEWIHSGITGFFELIEIDLKSTYKCQPEQIKKSKKEAVFEIINALLGKDEPPELDNLVTQYYFNSTMEMLMDMFKYLPEKFKPEDKSITNEVYVKQNLIRVLKETIKE